MYLEITVFFKYNLLCKTSQELSINITVSDKMLDNSKKQQSRTLKFGSVTVVVE